MEAATQFIFRLKQLTGKLTSRHDAFRHLHLLRIQNKPSARFAGSEWRGLVPRTSLLRRQFAALLKALD
jgi:hypothetical protein